MKGSLQTAGAPAKPRMLRLLRLRYVWLTANAVVIILHLPAGCPAEYSSWSHGLCPTSSVLARDNLYDRRRPAVTCAKLFGFCCSSSLQLQLPG